MARLAVMTFAILREPWGSPAVAGFEERTDGVFDDVAVADGMIAYDDDQIDAAGLTSEERWGRFTVPRLYPYDRSDPTQAREAVTLSIWRDIPSVFRFAYAGRHLEALQRRDEWVERRRPDYVLWWIDDDEMPSWAEACARLDRLHEEGPSPAAFDFHHPFDAGGRPTERPSLRS